MLKRFFELLGLAVMGVGIYFITANQSKNSVCNAIEGKYQGLGMSPACQHIVYSYFAGFVLLAVGVMVVVFGIFATRKSKKRRLRSKPSMASQYQWKNLGTGRGTPQ
jgi:hypothetical protein